MEALARSYPWWQQLELIAVSPAMTPAASCLVAGALQQSFGGSASVPLGLVASTALHLATCATTKAGPELLLQIAEAAMAAAGAMHGPLGWATATSLLLAHPALTEDRDLAVPADSKPKKQRREEQGEGATTGSTPALGGAIRALASQFESLLEGGAALDTASAAHLARVAVLAAQRLSEAVGKGDSEEAASLCSALGPFFDPRISAACTGLADAGALAASLCGPAQQMIRRAKKAGASAGALVSAAGAAAAAVALLDPEEGEELLEAAVSLCCARGLGCRILEAHLHALAASQGGHGGAMDKSIIGMLLAVQPTAHLSAAAAQLVARSADARAAFATGFAAAARKRREEDRSAYREFMAMCLPVAATYLSTLGSQLSGSDPVVSAYWEPLVTYLSSKAGSSRKGAGAGISAEASVLMGALALTVALLAAKVLARDGIGPLLAAMSRLSEVAAWSTVADAPQMFTAAIRLPRAVVVSLRGALGALSEAGTAINGIEDGLSSGASPSASDRVEFLVALVELVLASTESAAPEALASLLGAVAGVAGSGLKRDAGAALQRLSHSVSLLCRRHGAVRRPADEVTAADPPTGAVKRATEALKGCTLAVLKSRVDQGSSIEALASIWAAIQPVVGDGNADVLTSAKDVSSSDDDTSPSSTSSSSSSSSDDASGSDSSSSSSSDESSSDDEEVARGTEAKPAKTRRQRARFVVVPASWARGLASELPALARELVPYIITHSRFPSVMASRDQEAGAEGGTTLTRGVGSLLDQQALSTSIADAESSAKAPLLRLLKLLLKQGSDHAALAQLAKTLVPLLAAEFSGTNAPGDAAVRDVIEGGCRNCHTGCCSPFGDQRESAPPRLASQSCPRRPSRIAASCGAGCWRLPRRLACRWRAPGYQWRSRGCCGASSPSPTLLTLRRCEAPS